MHYIVSEYQVGPSRGKIRTLNGCKSSLIKVQASCKQNSALFTRLSIQQPNFLICPLVKCLSYGPKFHIMFSYILNLRQAQNVGRICQLVNTPCFLYHHFALKVFKRITEVDYSL